MPPRSLGPVSTKYRMLSSQARANSGQHGSSPGAAVRRTLEQASVGASSCLLLDTARSPWAPAQAPRVARVATLGLSTPPVAMESQGWRAAAQLDVVEAGPLPCVACVDAGSRFPCIIVSYRDQGSTQRACTPPCGARAVFDIYRYDTGIWGFIDSFRVVLVNGMRKWYASY